VRESENGRIGIGKERERRTMEKGKRVRMEARRGKGKERRMVEEEERVRMEGEGV
jgi:hypothetical protein